jgi:hypothetical protein
MESAQGTMRLRTGRPLWRAKVVCALAFSLLVGVCSYALTYHALTLIMSTSAATTVTPATTHTPSASTVTPVPSAPAATPTANP